VCGSIRDRFVKRLAFRADRREPQAADGAMNESAVLNRQRKNSREGVWRDAVPV